jgi:regulator of cell morphogenesis and NO signaling
MNQTTLPPVAHFGTDLSPAEVAARALDAFDALSPGEKVTLELSRAPRGLLARFQEELKGQFDWTPVLEGPETWRIEVSRRKAEKGALREVNEALSWDHDRLDDLEARAFKARESGDFAEAKALYTVFAFGLRRHIRFEEELLFPQFEAKAGFPVENGPTAVMRDEHREILQCLDRIESAIGDGAAPLESLRHALHLVLGNHNLKEENIVYPMTDRALGAQDGDALVARIQAL